MKTSPQHTDAARLERMVEISRELNSTTNLDELLTYIIREAAALTAAEAASVLLLDRQTRQLRFKATSNQALVEELVDQPVPLHGSIAGTVLQRDEPLIIQDVSRDPRWNPQVAQAINFQTRSILGVPMRDVERPVGVLEAINKKEGDFTKEDVETLSILADLAGVAVEKARLIEELQEAYEELNELDQLKTNFIALASHELRTPLSIILGYVSFLREQAGPNTAEQLDSILQAAIRLRSLIQDMLNFQYADTGEKELKLEEVDFVDLVRTMTAAKDETAEAKQQTITVRLPEEQLPVRADPGVIRVVLSNLINNAIKFTPEEGQISIDVKRHDDEVWLRVSDNGIGIPPDKLERIFRRFYQVEYHLSRRYEGMGLGLAIAKELVELHQGRIWAKNRKPKGSAFYVALPLHQSP